MGSKGSKSINIGISGVNPMEGNRGVGALSYSIISILDKLSEESGIRHNYYLIINGFSLDDSVVLDINGKRIKVKLIHQLDIYSLKRFAKIFIFFKDFLVYLKLDYVLDAGYGDSYSDVYGKDVFKTHNSIKKFFALLRKKQMLLPQTIGPFFDVRIQRSAYKAMGKMQILLARDKTSYDIVHKNISKVPSYEITDIAFYMPYRPSRLFKDTINVGLGVSKLLWSKSLNHKLNIEGDYRELIYNVVDSFLENENVRIFLVPHVVNDRSSRENDYELSYEICQEYDNDRVSLSPFFLDPIMAKNFISGLNFFAGARMHACIAAFSAGVPVFPIAYSRKFSGLFKETLKYEFMGDLTIMDNKCILRNLMFAFENRESLKARIEEISNTILKDRYNILIEQLTNFLNS